MKIANSNARLFVKSRMQFTGSNLYGKWVTDTLYVVYSYGDHWPLWIYDQMIDRWLENGDRYSKTTTTHKSRTDPYAETIVLPRLEMQLVLRNGGYDQWVTIKAARRLAGGAA